MEPVHVHILGASGAGTTTLGGRLAERLAVPFHDTDLFYWLASDPPFQEKREVPERCRLLRAALAQSESWVLSGSLCSWGSEFVPDFTTVIFVELDSDVRMARLRAREEGRYGARLRPGAEMHEHHVAFMTWAAQYESGTDAGRSRAVHERWLAELPPSCQVLRVSSERAVDELVREVVQRLR